MRKLNQFITLLKRAEETGNDDELIEWLKPMTQINVMKLKETMKILKRIRAEELKLGDEVILFPERKIYHGLFIDTIERTKKGKVLAFYGNYRNSSNSIFGHGLDPKQWITIVIEGEPEITNGFYDI